MIRINEAELLRAGFPRDLVNALRELQNLTASSVTQTDIDNLQVQINSADDDIQRLEQRIALNRVRSQLTAVEQDIALLRAQIAAQRQPDLAAILQRLNNLETIVNGAL